MFNNGKFIKIRLYGTKTGSKLGVTGPKHSINHSIVVTFIKIGCLQWSYDPKTGSKLGLSGPKWCQKLGCNTLKPQPGSNLGYGPQNGVRNGLFTQKHDLWTAFGYMGFSVYGLFGSGAFGYMGFWVYGLFGSHPERLIVCQKIDIQCHDAKR
jgi:hypothetical protein